MSAAVITEYGEFDATALADLVRCGEVSSLELVSEAIRRLEQVNGELNAVIHKMYDHARLSAAAVKGSERLAGVPLLMKNFCRRNDRFPISGR